jgi:hypothetical protein
MLKGTEMNERILELAKQAGLKFPSETALSPMEQKFAELLIRECTQLVQGVPTDTMGYHTADQKIKQHFGVE